MVTKVEARPTTPFHTGELEAQRRMGTATKIAPFAARAIRSFLPDQHREFFAELPFLILCAPTKTEHFGVTCLTGAPGFAWSPTSSTLHIGSLPRPGDPLFESLRPGSSVGILGIQPHTRRRNRANGVITRASEDGFEVRVEQSFGNCKQHITRRLLDPVQRSPARIEASTRLEGQSRHLVEKSDTFFIGTGVDDHGSDASHRGGPSGFVRVLSSRSVEFPDYSGNNFYNTVGNLLLDSRVGLLFIDFGSGDLLHISGRGTIRWNDARLNGSAANTERWIRVEIEDVVFRRAAWALSISCQTD